MNTNAPAPVASDNPSAPLVDLIPVTIDPAGYQWEHQGNVMMLTDMSRSDLIQALCNTMSSLELLESLQGDMAAVMGAWRNGQPLPELHRTNADGG